MFPLLFFTLVVHFWRQFGRRTVMRIRKMSPEPPSTSGSVVSSSEIEISILRAPSLLRLS